MTKQELRKLVEGKTAEEQELLLDLLGEDRLLAIYDEAFMLEIFTEANNARFARHIMNITGSKNVTVKQVYIDDMPYHITMISNNVSGKLNPADFGN